LKWKKKWKAIDSLDIYMILIHFELRSATFKKRVRRILNQIELFILYKEFYQGVHLRSKNKYSTSFHFLFYHLSFVLSCFYLENLKILVYALDANPPCMPFLKLFTNVFVQATKFNIVSRFTFSKFISLISLNASVLLSKLLCM